MGQHRRKRPLGEDPQGPVGKNMCRAYKFCVCGNPTLRAFLEGFEFVLYMLLGKEANGPIVFMVQGASWNSASGVTTQV